MSTGKRVVAIGGGIAVLAAGAFFVLNKKSPLDAVTQAFAAPKCPLTGVEPRAESLIDRPAVAIKVENNPVAYPLSGLEDAEIVYEEEVEGGLTRFVAIYHCTDTPKAGPVRSARTVDPGILKPFTLILGAAGGNGEVRNVLTEEKVVLIDEPGAGDAMTRVERPGISSEHTLYADSRALRKLGRKDYDQAPAEGIFSFGDLEGKTRKARTITIVFSPAVTVTYEWRDDAWQRSDNGEPLMSESGTQIAVDNVLIEEHTINYSALGDVVGARSTEIADETGTGRAVLFRDGRAIKGTWSRSAIDEPMRFETKSGDEMILRPGNTWIELVPDAEGEVKGSFSFEK
ncbi:MAG: DUF3048 domain-containing protein [Actinomycetota bacterium]|nr:DUF3048 domain-containing protein [Actinomycetota bacterium]